VDISATDLRLGPWLGFWATSQSNFYYVVAVRRRTEDNVGHCRIVSHSRGWWVYDFVEHLVGYCRGLVIYALPV
jgi:hypothetical protein